MEKLFYKNVLNGKVAALHPDAAKHFPNLEETRHNKDFVMLPIELPEIEPSEPEEEPEETFEEEEGN